MYYVYILKSKVTGRYYTGSTNDLKRRLYEHNNGKTRSLWKHRPLEIIKFEEYANMQDAKNRERQIKRYKSGEAFKKLIEKR
ncbi:MAG: GIY-YIG nuclease family protein [bacterium]|nr:GIY-YIG nuclease family protein [bacterium]